MLHSLSASRSRVAESKEEQKRVGRGAKTKIAGLYSAVKPGIRYGGGRGRTSLACWPRGGEEERQPQKTLAAAAAAAAARAAAR